jgi:hypothetical protein
MVRGAGPIAYEHNRSHVLGFGVNVLIPSRASILIASGMVRVGSHIAPRRCLARRFFSPLLGG